ncbi:MAG: hypothetical protein ACKVP7_17100 [Hyphomicrobiaceae bacterium]
MFARLAASALVGATLLLLSGPLAGDSHAQDKKAAPKSTAASGLRECRTKGQGGKVLTWKCKTDQPCCYNATQNLGVCGSPVIGCF